jgi:hypothetical protein
MDWIGYHPAIPLFRNVIRHKMSGLYRCLSSSVCFIQYSSPVKKIIAAMVD